MPDFEIHNVESAPEGSRQLLRGLQDQLGFAPNLAATMAESPTLLEAFLTLRSLAQRSSLEPVAREVVAIAVSVETGCSYCVAAHSTIALKSGADPGVVEAARSRATIADPRLQALARFARAVVQQRDLARAGLSPAQLLETLVAIAVPMLAASAFQLTAARLDDVFQPQAWTPLA
jgi:AhpD family alkylhydroperoxidase